MTHVHGPRRDAEYLRRKHQEIERRLRALEGGRRLDPDSGEGLGRPWLVFGDVWNEPPSDFWPSTTSASFATLCSAQGFCQHPYSLVLFRWRITDGSTTGIYQVRQIAVGQAEPVTHTIGTFSGPNSAGTSVPFVVACPAVFPDLVTVEIQARRTAGTGTVTAHVDTILGCGLESNPYSVLT